MLNTCWKTQKISSEHWDYQFFSCYTFLPPMSVGRSILSWKKAQIRIVWELMRKENWVTIIIPAHSFSLNICKHSPDLLCYTHMWFEKGCQPAIEFSGEFCMQNTGNPAILFAACIASIKRCLCQRGAILPRVSRCNDKSFMVLKRFNGRLLATGCQFSRALHWLKLPLAER